MNPNNNRSMLFGVVGGYLVYLAYELVKNLIDEVPTTMPKWLMVLVAVFFAAAGIALLVFAWKFWRKGREEPAEGRVEIDEDEAGETPAEGAEKPREAEDEKGTAKVE